MEQAALPEGFGEFVQVGVGVVFGDGGEPGIQGEPIGGSTFELRSRR